MLNCLDIPSFPLRRLSQRIIQTIQPEQSAYEEISLIFLLFNYCPSFSNFLKKFTYYFKIKWDNWNSLCLNDTEQTLCFPLEELLGIIVLTFMPLDL